MNDETQGNQKPVVSQWNEPKKVTFNIYHMTQENLSMGVISR